MRAYIPDASVECVRIGLCEEKSLAVVSLHLLSL